MALTTFKTTEHFVVMYDPAAFPNSIKRAQVLFGIVEQEFQILCDWFGVTDGFGPGNPIYTKAASPPNYGGQEGGYVAGPVPPGGDSMWINLDAQEGVADDSVAGEQIKAIFVAELAEILMAYANYRDNVSTWNRRGSNGEGLSHFCSVLRYPAGYDSYGLRCVNYWLQLPNREGVDWVNNTESSDVDLKSYGCATLFLFYLRSQRNFSERTIIQNGGATLAATYRAITGDTANPFALFTQLLRTYFPVGNTPALTTENPFPLRSATFVVSIEPGRVDTDGCQRRFLVVGGSVTLTALVGQIDSIYPATGITYRWDPPASGHLVGADDGKTATVVVDSAGILSVTVQVTVTTPTESVTQDQTFRITSLTPSEASLSTLWCRYWQETRFIPQPIPRGDPAMFVLPDAHLHEMEAVLTRNVEGAHALKNAVGKVLQERIARTRTK